MMRSPACEMFGIETAIFAFSHCRDVVVEASRAGGLGVLGTAHFTLEELKRELDWIVRHIEGRPCSNGPPLFPGLMEASVWMKLS